MDPYWHRSSAALDQERSWEGKKEVCCLPGIKSMLSAAARADRQLVCCVFPLISHISLWRDIIPDDCLSVMVYDEKCSGPLM